MKYSRLFPFINKAVLLTLADVLLNRKVKSKCYPDFSRANEVAIIDMMFLAQTKSRLLTCLTLISIVLEITMGILTTFGTR